MMAIEVRVTESVSPAGLYLVCGEGAVAADIGVGFDALFCTTSESSTGCVSTETGVC